MNNNLIHIKSKTKWYEIDIQFQKKCIDRLKMQIQSGKTILFVSHNMKSISDLCERCIVIKKER